MRRCLFIPIFFITGFVFAQKENLNMAIMAKIRNEGLDHSQVMEIAFHLTDANGPRLMQTPGYLRAAKWAKTKLASWGLENANLESWGNWGNGWELEKYYLAMTVPYYKPLIGFPRTFSKGTEGLQHTEVILIDAKDSSGLTAYHGLLHNKIILIKTSDSLQLGFQPDAVRYTSSDLERLAAYDPKAPLTVAETIVTHPTEAEFLSAVKKFAMEEGALGILTSSKRNSNGTVFVQNGIPYYAEKALSLNDISISFEDFKTIQRLLQHLIPVSVDLELKTRIFSEDLKAYNVIAEIPGTDKILKEELVMVGAHLDSWQGSTGATDNAAGSAVMMEVMRILKAIDYKPRRTIRIALWGGEETGIYGSANYVKNHFADKGSKKYNAAGDKLSVYFNLDNGSGKIRGIFLQNNAAAGPIFREWFQPFQDLGASTITLQNTGGTDFLSFDAIGLPGFQFIQDPLEYGSRTHHTNMDSYDHLSGEDLKQAATIIAAFVYDAAEREGKIPRKQ